jgi:hypothetical protein
MPATATFLLLAATAVTPPAAGIGQYGRWGAFAGAGPRACYVVAMPQRGREASAAVVAPPGVPRVELRIGMPVRPGSVVATVDEQAFPVAGDSVAVGHGRRIVAALRNGQRLRVTARSPSGRRIRHDYPLQGFASALDAATLGCLVR